jgi:outer membrane protein assembly factor BamB
MLKWIGVGLVLAGAWSGFAERGRTAENDLVRAYQADVAHDGSVTLSTGFGRKLHRVWTRDLGGPVSYPVVANGLIFVTVGNPSGAGSQLVALDLNTGGQVWAKAIGDPYWNRSNAAYDNGRVFLVDALGTVRAFSADASGRLLWKVQLTGQTQFMGPPTASQGKVILAGSGFGGTLYALAETNGALLWSAPVQNGTEGAPAFGDGGVYVTYPCQYYKFDPASGQLIWNFNDGCEGGGGATPVFHHKRLFVRWPIDARDSILDTESGDRIGTFPVAVPAPAVFYSDAHAERLVELDYFGNLLCSNVRSGKQRWSFSGDAQLASAPLVVNGEVFEGSYSGNLYLLDGDRGRVLWSDNVGAPIAPPDEQNDNGPLTGLAAVGNMLLVPASHLLVAYARGN